MKTAKSLFQRTVTMCSRKRAFTVSKSINDAGEEENPFSIHLSLTDSDVEDGCNINFIRDENAEHDEEVDVEGF